jgi:large subunit ribosomal protein L33
MAKKKSYNLVQLINSEVDTPTKYVVKVPTKGPKASNKLSLRKYDPVTRKHHVFIQKKLPNPKG